MTDSDYIYKNDLKRTISSSFVISDSPNQKGPRINMSANGTRRNWIGTLEETCAIEPNCLDNIAVSPKRTLLGK